MAANPPLVRSGERTGRAGTPAPTFPQSNERGILFVLRTGCQWKSAAQMLRFWFDRPSPLPTVGEGWDHRCDRAADGWVVRPSSRGIDWEWQAADTKLLAAPLGGEATGPNPTDLGKSGTKRHLLVDGRGVPLAFHLSAANRHDLKGLPRLLGPGLLAARPEPSERPPQHLCLDKAYDAEEADELLEALGYVGHIKRRGEDDVPGVGELLYPARRWKVERSISWLNNMRKLRVRWEKKAENYRGLWLLAAALITYRRIILG